MGKKINIEDETLLKMVNDSCNKVEGLSNLSWEDILTKYEIKMNPDTLRKGFDSPLGGYPVYQMMKRKIMELTDNKDSDISKEIEILNDKIDKMETERKKLQATKIEYNRIKRKNSRFELFYENVKSAIESLPLPEFETIQVEETTNSDYVLGLADIHYNAEFTSVNNEYSREIAKERFEKLLADTTELVKKNKIPHITVIENGDTIQGMLRISDVKLNDVPITDSVVEISRIIGTFLNELSKVVKITYRHTMASNHSQCRYLGTKASEMPLEDMERIIGNYIKDLVAENNRIEVILPEHDYDSFEICGQNILSMHGHQVKSVDKTIRDYSTLHRKFYDICFLAHFHGGKSMSVGEGNGNTEVVILPSFIGSDPYSDSLKVGSKAMCKLFKIEESKGITEEYRIILN